jgi:hypothetical protein
MATFGTEADQKTRGDIKLTAYLSDPTIHDGGTCLPSAKAVAISSGTRMWSGIGVTVGRV